MTSLKSKFDPSYWDNRYQIGQDGWDIGDISTPIKTFFDQVENKEISILIPGCGRAHEASYLLSSGFQNITILDYSHFVVDELSKKFALTPIKVVQSDILKFEGKFDIIVEQTMFCALDPSLREAYISKIYDLLNPNGKYIGLLFANEFEKPGPPFGGTKSEYLRLFEKTFIIDKMELCYNSISARQGNELWINMRRNDEPSY